MGWWPIKKEHVAQLWVPPTPLFGFGDPARESQQCTEITAFVRCLDSVKLGVLPVDQLAIIMSKSSNFDDLKAAVPKYRREGTPVRQDRTVLENGSFVVDTKLPLTQFSNKCRINVDFTYSMEEQYQRGKEQYQRGKEA